VKAPQRRHAILIMPQCNVAETLQNLLRRSGNNPLGLRGDVGIATASTRPAPARRMQWNERRPIGAAPCLPCDQKKPSFFGL
jgi:hypothetical protein